MLLICSLLFALLSSSGSWAQEYRLSKDVIPSSYDIAIKPYLRTTDGPKLFTFDGEVNITLQAVVENVKSITLHKDYIEILDTILYDGEGKLVQRIATAELIYETATDKLTVPLQSPLALKANYNLYFNYTGQIRSGLAGVFRGSYDGVNWYAITQLQRIDARTAFPCFDEPQLKAKFRMRITRPKEYLSFFNTRLLSTTIESDGWYTDHFDETPPMSTYLAAFIIGDFNVQGDNDFKMIMHSKVSNNTQYSHEVALKTMAAYDVYTQIPYKSLGNTLMQKAGSVRFPHNGMENWGLVIYLDTVLSHEPGYTDGWSNKEYTVTILVHETAHMWFGNSVTFKWWSYFWLNEAFARYYQYFLANEIYPEFELDKQFVVNQIHLIFATDATNSTQPLTSPEASINSPSQVAYKFSGITYAKGAAIVRMICNLMGKNNFDTAIREYLKENHLKSTEPEDLFVHWKRHWPAGHEVDLNQFLSDWTEQPGFPMISIFTTKEGRYSLQQKRFLLDAQDGSDSTLKYTIPITYTNDRERNFEDLTPRFYFNKSMNQLQFGNSRADEWIILNLQQSNFHRVFYDEILLERLRKAFRAANRSGIHQINRAHLVDDLFTYGRIGILGYDVIFEFMEYLADEIEYLPWNPAFKAFETISQRLTLAQHEKFGEFLFDIMDKVYKKLGFNFNSKSDTVLDIYNRNKVIGWLCKYHHQDCNEEAQREFQFSLSSQVPADFQETLYCSACRDGSFDFYYSLSTMYKGQQLPSQKEKLLRSMGCTRHFVAYHYAFILSNEVPLDSKSSAINSLYSQTPENVEPVYLMVTEKVEVLADILGSWSSTASVISGIANYFTTQHQLDMLKEFIETKGHLFGTSVSTLENAVTAVEKNLLWSERHLGKLFQYLDQRNGAISLSGIIIVMPHLAMVVLKLLW
ncbi:membrane alanyl aminopeptidase [Stomoxys calcitrans]|uniref:membrane alanyl aminopeptidase n=1 Tax=Stomoxys calcitrans TaxID=35570 RepID=UPI0027E22302|nr:membrane alanyl aminopeptidase [Stomoxys calcitrans]